MSINYEIKGMLARLLATEDLIVEHRKVETAQFDVQRRLLTLPMWEKASNSIYDLLVSHEVGHALFTPNEDWTEKTKVPKSFINIVEDARVEKLIKRKYAGLAKTFFNGYKDLNEMDFFSIEDEDVSKMNLADRSNLYFKVGNFVDINFTDKEKEIVKLIADTESFDEVLNAAKVLYDYCKEEENIKEEEVKVQMKPQGGSSAPMDLDKSDKDDSQESNSDSLNQDIETGSPQSYAEDKQDNNQEDKKEKEVEIKTDEIMNQKSKEFINEHSEEIYYIETPKLYIDNIIADNKEVHEYIDEYYDEFVKGYKDRFGCATTSKKVFEYPDQKYTEFKNSAQKEVNYLVKEFECRKAADSYARASQSKTGVLDCAKLHTYKYNEDLFKKVTTFADGKNHGLIFILDWSGSMANVMVDTLKQLYNIIWFCKKVSIPFEVYAFSEDFYHSHNGTATKLPQLYDKKEGVFCINQSFRLMNILTSKTNSSTLEHQMKNIWRVCWSFKNYTTYSYPPKMSLSGTPLSEALICLHEIIPNFQKQNKLQKVHCMVLTDGESNGINFHVTVQRHWEKEPYFGVRNVGYENCFIRDRKTGNTYKVERDWNKFQDTLIRNLRDKFPYVSFIGMRLVESRDGSYFIRRYYEYDDQSKEYIQVMNDWKKNRSCTIKRSGYHKYFAISANALSSNSVFSVSEEATKTQIKHAFAKSLHSKKMNKKILGEFIELIA